MAGKRKDKAKLNEAVRIFNNFTENVKGLGVFVNNLSPIAMKQDTKHEKAVTSRSKSLSNF